MADPKALGEVLKNHIIEGYYPEEFLPVVDGKPKPLINMLGVELAFSGSIDEVLRDFNMINDINVGDSGSFMVANGTRLSTLSGVLLPPSQ